MRLKVIGRWVSYVQPRNWGERCKEQEGLVRVRFEANHRRRQSRKARRPERFMHPRFQTPLRGNRSDYIGSLTDLSDHGARTVCEAKVEATSTGDQVRRMLTQTYQRWYRTIFI